MTARLWCNTVYAWLMAGAGADADARAELDAKIYAPAAGAEITDARIWAAIMSSED
jgi:hypothetical protein